MKDLIERLREAAFGGHGHSLLMQRAADLLERIYAQPLELPEPELMNIAMEKVDAQGQCPVDAYYSADQLTKAVQEATARALEAAAKECEARYMGDNNREDMEAKRCASAIRNLIGRVK